LASPTVSAAATSAAAAMPSTTAVGANGYTVNSPLLFYGTERSTRSKVIMSDVPFHYIPDPALSNLDVTADNGSKSSAVTTGGDDEEELASGNNNDGADDENEDGDGGDDAGGDSDEDENDQDDATGESKPDRKRSNKRYYEGEKGKRNWWC